MRVKLQLVISHDDGHEETVTDVITLNKTNLSGDDNTELAMFT